MKINISKYKYRLIILLVVLSLELCLNSYEFYKNGAINIHMIIIATVYVLLAYLAGLGYDKNRLYILQYKNNEYLLKKQLESEKKFRKVFDNANDGMYLSVYNNGDWELIDVNRKALEILGYTKEEFIKLNLEDISDMSNIERLNEKLSSNVSKKVLSSEELQEILSSDKLGTNWTYITKNSDKVPSEVSHKYFNLDSQDVALVIFRDITERIAREENLRKSKEEAEELNKLKNKFIAIISHEIRNPMNAVAGALELLSNTELTKEQREYVEILINSEEIIESIINDILDIAKVESGKMEIYNEQTDIQELVKNSIISYEFLIKGKVELLYDIDSKIPRELIGDSRKLKQILSNLIVNAIKFTNKGKIEVNVGIIKEEADNIELKFSVKDTGIGIKKEDLDKLFKPFSQLDNSISREYKGTGLGLAISKSLVEIMGGNINVESKEGVGSIFYFNLNFSKSNNINKKINNNIEENLEGLSILVAEDDIVNQKIMKTILEKKNAKVKVVSNGKEVLDILKNYDFDIIIMDLQMPEMGGLETTLCIRNKGINTPIIALTGDVDKKMCINVGMQGHIPKPIDANKLYKIIEKFTK